MKHLESIWKKGKEFLGVKTPIIAGAMTWISDSRPGIGQHPKKMPTFNIKGFNNDNSRIIHIPNK
jgi:hypothetical protein